MRHSKTLSTLVAAQSPNMIVCCRTQKRADELQEIAKEHGLKPIKTKVINDIR